MGLQVENDTIDYKLHFISLPLMINYYPIEKLKLSVGPEVRFLHKANNIVNDTTTISILSNFDKKWEFSGSVGLSYSISFYADLGLRYNKSFSVLAERDPILDTRNLNTGYLRLFLMLKIAN